MNYKKIIELINNHPSFIENKNNQMDKCEYFYIAEKLENKNVLVFGTGYDSDIWREAVGNRKVLFLEHNDKWINPSGLDVRKVEYSTIRTDWMKLLLEFKNNDYSNLKMDLSPDILNSKWDYILVDSPEGGGDKHPGRMQSIFMAWFLSNENTEVFVHDCNREVEDMYTKEMFEIKAELVKLRHCKRKF